jgi:Mlc titration factor MtfA (ptsG expression regulator)
MRLRDVGRWLLDVVGREPSDAEKRAALRSAPFPDAWSAILSREMPHYRRLDAQQRAKLHGDVLVFVGEKPIVGIEGFTITEHAKVLVAGCAALVALGTDIAIFDHVTRVMIRPKSFHSEGRHAGGLYQPFKETLGGRVVGVSGEVELAWTQVAGAFGKLEGQNTTLHELAHAFDHRDGELDALVAHPSFERWKSKLRDLPLDRRRDGWWQITQVIGDVEGPELFAHATELFFECPRRLHAIDAALFDALRAIYSLDPRELVDG